MKTSRTTAAIQTQTSNNIQLQFITPNIKTQTRRHWEIHTLMFMQRLLCMKALDTSTPPHLSRTSLSSRDDTEQFSVAVNFQAHIPNNLCSNLSRDTCYCDQTSVLFIAYIQAVSQLREFRFLSIPCQFINQSCHSTLYSVH